MQFETLETIAQGVHRLSLLASSLTLRPSPVSPRRELNSAA